MRYQVSYDLLVFTGIYICKCARRTASTVSQIDELEKLAGWAASIFFRKNEVAVKRGFRDRGNRIDFVVSS